MRTLVTGGAGFIGSHLCDSLIARGHSVVCLDSFVTGVRANIAHLLGNPRFSLITHDVREPIYLKVDRIYHLACPASPVHYQADPILTLETAFLGTLHMLRLAEQVGARMLLASTSEVYGDPLQHPQHESYWGNVNPVGPRSCYDEGKRAGETLAAEYRRHRAVDVRTVRIFNTYGPRMREDDGRVVSNFVVQALRGEPLTIFGDGSQTRSFCFVTDMVEGLLRSMEVAEVSGPVNIGNPAEFTVKWLAEEVLTLTGSSAGFVYRPLPVEDPIRRRPDITLAQSLFRWQPRVSLRQGLEETIAYFRSFTQSGKAVL